jgi:Sigma-70 region 2
MEEQAWLAKRFEENRGHLKAGAYRMLGSVTEADDAVQDAWLRLSRADVGGVQNLTGWLTTVVARLCLDTLRSRKARREEPLDTHVPDPIVTRESGMGPEHETLLADSVGLALLVGSKRWIQPNVWRSCCTICSQFRSMNSHRFWAGLRPRPDSSRAAHAAGCKGQPRLPMQT